MGKDYSNLKIFHFDSKLDDLKKGVISAPLHIRLKPRNKCNHSCWYCCYRTNKLELSEKFVEEDEIPWPKMQELIEDFSEMNVRAITFSGGGEPLSYAHIAQTAKMLIKEDIKIATLTNGTHLTGEIGEIFGQHASWVRISMDAADAQTYAKTRRVDLNEFDLICENIKHFAQSKSGQCEFGINFIVSKHNYKDTYKFLQLMKDLGINHVKVNECVVSTDGAINKNYYKDIEADVREQLGWAQKNLVDNSFGLVDQFCHFDPKVDSYQKHYSQCPFIQCLTVIAADLNVYTCQDKAYTTSGIIGSIKDQRFKDLWFSEEAKARLTGLNPSLECNHHCTQHLKNLELLEFMNIRESNLEFV